MELRDKKTGERGIINYFDNQCIVIYPIDKNWKAKGDKKYVYHSLSELNEEWEDVPEEPKGYWHIAEMCGGLQRKQDTDNGEDRFNKQIGNYFETEEEAEKAVEKLKAWKRLEDKGFEFRWIDMQTGQIKYSFFLKEGQKITRGDEDDLLLLFGGEE